MGSLAAEIPHPFDPLSLEEIQSVITLVKKAHGDVYFNVVSLHEPRKAEMTAWLAEPEKTPRPARVADVVVIAPGGAVYDGLVDIKTGSITHWEQLDGLQPIVSKFLQLVVSKYPTQDNKTDLGFSRSPWRSFKWSSISAVRIPV